MTEEKAYTAWNAICNLRELQDFKMFLYRHEYLALKCLAPDGSTERIPPVVLDRLMQVVDGEIRATRRDIENL